MTKVYTFYVGLLYILVYRRPFLVTRVTKSENNPVNSKVTENLQYVPFYIRTFVRRFFYLISKFEPTEVGVLFIISTSSSKFFLTIQNK